ncbi:hypothetical protein [Streptomyces sp. NPDC093707]|uniref:hypothetical protein n=1 Tax=Streptomyces sp. NPDC093707 TaxID=3154984 RepID=UPI003450534B
MPPQPRRVSRGNLYLAASGLFLACLMVGGGLWLKYHTGWLNRMDGGNAWALTYEADAVGGEGHASAVRYRFNLDRYEEPHRFGRVGRTQLPWSKHVLVNTGQPALVEVDPEGDTVATCRILLDDVRVVAEGRSPAPGRPAVCQVTTSSTPEKWPR